MFSAPRCHSSRDTAVRGMLCVKTNTNSAFCAELKPNDLLFLITNAGHALFACIKLLAITQVPASCLKPGNDLNGFWQAVVMVLVAGGTRMVVRIAETLKHPRCLRAYLIL